MELLLQEAVTVFLRIANKWQHKRRERKTGTINKLPIIPTQIFKEIDTERETQSLWDFRQTISDYYENSWHCVKNFLQF